MSTAMVPRATVIALVGAVALALSTPEVLTAQATPERGAPPDRIERLETWVAATERHDPGVLDAPVREIGTWDLSELHAVWVEVNSLVSSVRDPTADAFFVPPEPRSTIRPSGRAASRVPPPQRHIRIGYSLAELLRLRRLAAEVARRPGADDRVLKRGAMLHADIAILTPPAGPSSQSGGSQRLTLYLSDGQPAGMNAAISHWSVGRRFLELVRPPNTRDGPGGDPVVRMWYLAGASYMHKSMLLDLDHFNRALELFPEDPQTLFVTAALHDTLSGPQIQNTMRSAAMPRNVVFDILSAEDELREAERLYRRAVDRSPDLAEARIRLGRVLQRRGRHKEAATELRRGLAATQDQLFQYYGSLFLGASSEPLGERDEARQLYERAAGLYPKAQSPLLALGQLAARNGDRPGSREANARVMALPAVADARLDPWWDYDQSAGRDLDRLLDILRRAVRTGAAP